MTAEITCALLCWEREDNKNALSSHPSPHQLSINPESSINHIVYFLLSLFIIVLLFIFIPVFRTSYPFISQLAVGVFVSQVRYARLSLVTLRRRSSRRSQSLCLNKRHFPASPLHCAWSAPSSISTFNKPRSVTRTQSSGDFPRFNTTTS
jgi:hypothetical protein